MNSLEKLQDNATEFLAGYTNYIEKHKDGVRINSDDFNLHHLSKSMRLIYLVALSLISITIIIGFIVHGVLWLF